MKILSTFDRVVTEVLADKVRARLTFKVSPSSPYTLAERILPSFQFSMANMTFLLTNRVTWIPTDSATKSGRF